MWAILDSRPTYGVMLSRLRFVVAALCVVTSADYAHADMFGSGANTFDIEFVTIGNPGNPADARFIDPLHPNGVGAVADPFRIGKTEVTNAEYVAFLNAVAASDPYGLYNTFMASETYGGVVRSGISGSYTYDVKASALSGTYLYDKKPVVYVSSGDAMRFANWLHNGQPTGPEDATTTEDGAYTLNGAVTDTALAGVTRNPSARWWLPSADEWYKAAYHKNIGTTGNYWNYPTGADSVPNNNPPSSDTGNSANYNDPYGSGYTTGDIDYPLTDAGAYPLSDSPYGTFDQGGNVWEWNETLYQDEFFREVYRGIRGGAWNYFPVGLHASSRDFNWPGSEANFIGFRVAGIPGPSGDYNGNGIVDAADYILWRNDPASYGGDPVGYNTWRADFGATAGSGADVGAIDSIPEPACFLLAIWSVLGLIGVGVGWGRKR
jgi:formylglycine-generating enzyme required for sulfatase activity